MNKVILSLLLAVCILGMALIMLNERLGRKSEPVPAPTAEAGEPAAPDSGAGLPPLSADAARNGFTAPAAPQEAAREEPKLPPLPGDDAAEAAPVAEQVSERAQTPPAAPADPGSQAAARENMSTPPAMERTAQSAKTESSAPARSETKKEERRAQTDKSKAEKAKTEKPGAEKAAAPRERSISRFVVFARDKGATVRLEGNAPLRYKSMNLTNPDRVVVDLDGQWQIKAPGVPKNPLVSNVRIGKMADKTRVVIDLKAKPQNTRFVLAKDGNTLDVRVDQ